MKGAGRIARAVAIAALATAGSLTGCECVAGLDEDVRLGGSGVGGAASSGGSDGGGAPSPSSGAGGDVGSTGGGPGGDATGGGGGAPRCDEVGYPLPPSGSDVGGDVELVVAVRSIVVAGDEEDLRGLNLDRTCTCPGPSSCVSSADADLVCDLEGGRDIQSARLFGQIALLTNDQFSSAELSENAEEGGWSLLMRIEDWTGEPDDPRVRFTLHPSPGFDEDKAVRPAWNGTDAWMVDRSSVGPSGDVDDALYVDEAAYVTGGKIVASLPQSGLTLSNEESIFTLRLSGAFLVATIVQEEGLYGLRDGVLAGVWPSDGIFDALDDFRDGDGEPLCTDNAIYGIARNTICDTVDMFDGLPAPTSPCNAISIGIAFSADEAQLGIVADPPEPTPGCAPSLRPSTCKCGDDC